MSAERKLEYFAEVISREVELRKRRAKHQMANDISKNLAAAISAAEEKTHSRVGTARRNAIKKSNKIIAFTIRQEKAKFNSLRGSLEEKLFYELSEELKIFTQSKKYPAYLIERINNVKANFTTVKLCPRDLIFADEIKNATGLSTEMGENDYIGGFILLSENGRVQADYTFKTRTERAVFNE